MNDLQTSSAEKQPWKRHSLTSRELTYTANQRSKKALSHIERTDVC